MADNLHFTPRDHWMNDPNGFIWYGGEYHMFYQYFPYESRWGTMHWGHKTSKDLVHWTDQGIALYPSNPADRNGCFSGSAICVDGKMYLYYTSIAYSAPNGTDIHTCGGELIASQSMLISEDGYHFPTDTKEVIVPTFPKNQINAIGDYSDSRDPKVWREDDYYYMVLGSKGADNGNLLIYRSLDAKKWCFCSTIEDPRIKSSTWECPNIICMDGIYYLIMSPIDYRKREGHYPSNSFWCQMNFAPKAGTGRIQADLSLVDYGEDLYAPQISTDEHGNQVMFGWLRMPVPTKEDTIGMLTFPRLLKNKDGRLHFSIHPNVDRLFQRKIDLTQAQSCLKNREALKISVKLSEGQSVNLGGYRLHREEGCLHVDRRAVFLQGDTLYFGAEINIGNEFQTPVLEGDQLDIYMDEYCIEIYAKEDGVVLSNVIYSTTDEIDLSYDCNAAFYTL